MDGNSKDDMMTMMIVLNVGGVKYQTTIGTLLYGAPNTYFAHLLQEQREEDVPRDADGHIFIDRDGDVFAWILGYLRSGGHIDTSHLSTTYINRIVREAMYFGLNSLVGALLSSFGTRGGTSYLTSITPASSCDTSSIINAISKANLLILSFSNGHIECWMYKGLASLWVHFFTLEPQVGEQLHQLTASITKNKYNEVSNLILSGFTTNKQVALWKIRIDYVQFQAVIVINGHYLATISKSGKITLVEIANDSEGLLPMKTLDLNHSITAIADMEHHLFVGCNNGEIYEIKQNMRDNWDWSTEQVYKLNNIDYLQNQMFAMAGYKDDETMLKRGFECQPRPTPTMLEDNGELVTNASLAQTYTDPSMAMAIGTLEGTVHLGFRNIRRKESFIPGAKLVITAAAAAVAKQPDGAIDSLVVSGGNEGVFITAKTNQNLTKSWQYKYTNPIYPHMTKCVSVRTGADRGHPSPFNDIIKFKTFHHLHYVTPKTYGAKVPLIGVLGKSVSGTNISPSLTSANSSSNNGKGNGSGASGSDQSMAPNITLEEPDPRNMVSTYNQIYIDVDQLANEVAVYAQSHNMLGDGFPSIGQLHDVMQRPLATFPLVDTTPIKLVLPITYGGVDPSLSDMAYQLITIHESNQVCCWDLRDIDHLFGILSSQSYE
ncbi:hypothetical protein SAMD00019534_011100 [Acytostelium subglobosum LB1]|uniref:hypothetical protein n=1 Tax=Acytostelium subglobosum LB1 TaxID=1410327 RepID=UPI00064500DC|nr:hypothetical protein SAMD00019534_011100 [Acytostelium subglobosum LB1]GAM17935.1 hypothetical protein SAMD00019534_011100 [Acytostelium subglobosum LB1]|eukprot:XP_012758531.1 hypothetical protein SAMD00019534_011100 [Acytostelium subglobosum LB1]